MKQKIILCTTLSALLFTSCNGGNQRIKRVEFNETNHENAIAIYKAMKTQQETTFPNKGNTTIRYSIKANGNARLDDMSFYNLDINASAGFIISWSLEDHYLKLEGEKEIYYYVIYENEVWLCKEYEINGAPVKRRKKQTDFDYKSTLTDSVDRYALLQLPGICNLGLGLTGTNSYVEGEALNPLNYQPDYLFDEDTFRYFNYYSEFYKAENKGYSSNVKYCSNDNNTVSCNIKGKYKSHDLTKGKRDLGDVNCDMYASFKNNFLYQGEYYFKGNCLDYRMNNFNVNFDLYLSQEVEIDKCVIDQVNVLSYMTE